MSNPPKETHLFPNVRGLVAPNPSLMTPWGTNTYLVGDKQVIVVDPGPDSTAHLEAVCASVERLKATTLAVIPTHPHPDHDGCASDLARRLDAPVLRWGRPLKHDEVLTVGETTVQVKHTPGHVDAHICLWLSRERLLFAGDLVAGSGTVVVIPPDGDMADYLVSLRDVQALKPVTVLPGHGPVIEQPVDFLQAYIDHRLKREQEIFDWTRRGVTDADAIAAHIYGDRPEVRRVAVLQVTAHLQKLEREGRL